MMQLRLLKRCKTIIKRMLVGARVPDFSNFKTVEESGWPFNKIGANCYLNNCTIGPYTYLAQNVTAMNTQIGKFCSIGQDVAICLGKHPSQTFVSTHPAFFSSSCQNGMTFSDRHYFNEQGSVTIGHDVWIGAKAIILDDIEVGNGAIIGAGAVVTKNVPAFSIVIGIPAKILRYRFGPEEIEFLQAFKWWDKEQEWLEGNFKELHDIQSFIDKFKTKRNI